LDCDELLERDDALRGRRLVGGCHEQITRLLETAEGCRRAWKQRDVIRDEWRLGKVGGRVADELVDDPVAVKERGRPPDR
jgi:hypothetical protein